MSAGHLSGPAAPRSSHADWSWSGTASTSATLPPPYLPLVEAFTRLPAPRADALASRYPPIARLLHRNSPVQDGRIDRGAMLDAVLAALSALAEEQPVLLVIEDLHWADMAMRDLLGYVFTRMADLPGVSLAVLATVRSDDLNRRHPLRALATAAGGTGSP